MVWLNPQLILNVLTVLAQITPNQLDDLVLKILKDLIERGTANKDDVAQLLALLKPLIEQLPPSGVRAVLLMIINLLAR